MDRTVVVIAAHAFEARAAAGVGQGMTKEPWGRWMLYRGEMWDIPLAVIRCGPGKVAAAAAAQAAVQYLEPAVFVTFGVAGAPERELKTGTMVIPESVVDVALAELSDLPVAIPFRFVADTHLREKLLQVPGTTAGNLLCWEGQVVSSANRPNLMQDLEGAVAIDWESSAVAQVSNMWEVPWGAVKVVSDHGESDRLRRVAAVAKRPLQWAAEIMRRACIEFLRDMAETVWDSEDTVDNGTENGGESE